MMTEVEEAKAFAIDEAVTWADDDHVQASRVAARTAVNALLRKLEETYTFVRKDGDATTQPVDE